MEETEVPTEHLQEEIHHHAHASNDRWQMQVALTSALLAVMAALAALLSGHAANEGMLEQIHSSDSWAHYQAKSIKLAIHQSRLETLAALGKTPEKSAANLDRYEKEQEEIAGEAKHEAELSAHHLARHGRFSLAVTFFQVAIGVAAISVLTRRRHFWQVSLVFGLAGLAGFVAGLLVKI